MSRMDLPGQYVNVRKKYPQLMEALDGLGDVVSHQGPIDEKNSHLIRMAAAAAIRSEGAVHSHARRALQSGATPEEVNQAIILLTSTIGFPNVSAALTWADDILQDR